MLNKAFMGVLVELFGETTRVIFEIKEGLSPENVTPVQYNILEYLFYRDKESTVSNIASCMYLSLPNASRELSKLIQKGYLVKVASQQDRRVYHIKLSAYGEKIMGEAFNRLMDRVQERYGHLDISEQELLMEQMANMIKKILF